VFARVMLFDRSDEGRGGRNFQVSEREGISSGFSASSGGHKLSRTLTKLPFLTSGQTLFVCVDCRVFGSGKFSLGRKPEIVSGTHHSLPENVRHAGGLWGFPARRQPAS
jgi:hypothetical protein